MRRLVGDFTDKQLVRVRVWTKPSRSRDAEYALEAAIKIIDYYADYFGQPYPLPKQDLIAIPEYARGDDWFNLFSFEVGAMISLQRILPNIPCNVSSLTLPRKLGTNYIPRNNPPLQQGRRVAERQE